VTRLRGLGLAAKGVREKTLQCFDLAPSLLLRSLNDTYLEPTHVVFTGIPIDGMPVGHLVDWRGIRARFCWSEFFRHLLSFLESVYGTILVSLRPSGSGPAFTGGGRTPLSIPLTSIAFAFSALLCPLSHGLTLRLPTRHWEDIGKTPVFQRELS
jgi:hypothetical protein